MDHKILFKNKRINLKTYTLTLQYETRKEKLYREVCTRKNRKPPHSPPNSIIDNLITHQVQIIFNFETQHQCGNQQTEYLNQQNLIPCDKILAIIKLTELQN